MEELILQRIKEIIRRKGVSMSQISSAYGIKQNTFSRQISGESSLSASSLLSIIGFFPDLSAEWLMRGEGPMLRSDPSQSIGDIIGSTAVGNNVHGSGNNITNNSELAALQQQYLEMLKKRDEQIDRLTAVIERLTAKL